MQLSSWASIAGPALAAIGAIAGLLWKRYRGSAGKELQPFRSYVAGSLRLAVTRRVRPKLAGRIAVRAYADVTLRGFPRHMPIPSRGRSSLDIERAYIRLSLSASPSVERRVDDEALLIAKGAVLVFGEPGSGKSSLTRKLHREALKQAYLRPMRSRLPLHFELGKLPWDELPPTADARLDWLRGMLRERVTRVRRVNKPDYVFSAFAEGPGLFVTFDGLDEVPSDRVTAAQSLLTAAIEAFRHESPDTLVIVTARTQMRGVLTRGFLEGFGEVLTVTPFTPADVFAFLRRWDFPAQRRLAEVHRIFDHLRNNATLSEMCTNPLVLAMYVAEDEEQTRSAGSAVRLADTRAKFYDQVVGELLYFRREDQRQQRPTGMRLLVTRQELLGRIALDHLLHSEDPANVISLSRAARIAQEHGELDDPDQAEQWLEELAVETGLVTVQARGETLQFIHLGIAEYLAGKELAERSESELQQVLKKLAGDQPEARRLWELAVFAVALSNRETREAALLRLAEAAAPIELTLRVTRELQAYDLPVFRRLIETATREVSGRPLDEWNTEWLRLVRLVLSCLADAQRIAPVSRPAYDVTPADWLQPLVHGEGARFERIFELYLTAGPAEALRVAGELGMHRQLLADRERIVSTLEHPDVVAFVMRTVADAPEIEGWIDVLAEAALRYELVAQTLFEEPAPAKPAELAGQVDARFAWDRIGPAAGTFLGAVLAVATSRAKPIAEADGPREVSQVDLVATVRARSRGPLIPLRLAVLFGFLLIVAFGSVVWAGISFADQTASSGWLVLIGVASVCLSGSFARFSWTGRIRRLGGSSDVGALLNIDAGGHRATASTDFFVTRLGDGVVRLFLFGGFPEGDLTFSYRGEGSFELAQPGTGELTVMGAFDDVDISRWSPFVQISIVSRRGGRLRCIPDTRRRGA